MLTQEQAFQIKTVLGGHLVRVTTDGESARILLALWSKQEPNQTECRSLESGACIVAFGEPDDLEDDDSEQRCTNPGGHKFECTGTAYGGDDARWHGEGRCLCIHCGADGDA